MADRETHTLERQNESLPSLFARLTDELTRLFDAKLELLKAEIKQEVRAYGLGAVLIVIGVVVATIGFALLNVAIAFLISMLVDGTHLSPAARYGLGFISTGLLHLVIGGIIIIVANNWLANE